MTRSAVAAPAGRVTRGTTAHHRLRRVDRWLLAMHRPLLTSPDLLVVDLGFGARPVTTVELARCLQRINAGVRVVGLEIDPERVATAAAAPHPGVDYRIGGFELAGVRPHVVRAMNVLRQYDEADVDSAWTTMIAALLPGGVVVEGTCAETGRLGAWISLDETGPRTLTLSVDLMLPPSAVAARLPKALIHRNVAGSPIHALLCELDRHWRSHAPLAVFGARQRFSATVAAARAEGWPVIDGPSRWRRGEVTLAWHAMSPFAR